MEALQGALAPLARARQAVLPLASPLWGEGNLDFGRNEGEAKGPCRASGSAQGPKSPRTHLGFAFGKVLTKAEEPFFQSQK